MALVLTLFVAYRAAVASEKSTVQVERVIDGDTVVLVWREGRVHCRLIGIDAPERGKPFGKESTEYVRGWLEGKSARISFDGDYPTFDRYNRLLAYLYADEGRVMVNLELVKKGLARYLPGYPTNFKADFISAEANARAKKIGVWSVTQPTTVVPTKPVNVDMKALEEAQRNLDERKARLSAFLNSGSDPTDEMITYLGEAVGYWQLKVDALRQGRE